MALNLESAIRRRAGGGGLRRKVHVADLITTPGTIEAEWYNSYSSSGNYLMPSLLKVTPLTGDSLLARTEFSLGFDPIEREQMTVSALSVLTSSPKFSVAAGPQV